MCLLYIACICSEDMLLKSPKPSLIWDSLGDDEQVNASHMTVLFAASLLATSARTTGSASSSRIGVHSARPIEVADTTPLVPGRLLGSGCQPLCSLALHFGLSTELSWRPCHANIALDACL